MDIYKILQILTAITSAFSAIFAIYSVISSNKEKKPNIQIENVNHLTTNNFLVFKMTISNNSSLPISITSIDIIQNNITNKCSIESFCYDFVMVFENSKLTSKCVGKTSDFPICISAYSSSPCCVAVKHQDNEANQHTDVTLSIHTNRDKKSQSKSLHIHL